MSGSTCVDVFDNGLFCANLLSVSSFPGDLILCFQEGKNQALYFDAHVLDAQRRRHDAHGCRCRFLVHYDHDQSEEIVPLRKVCRRPETEYRLRILHATKTAVRATSPFRCRFLPSRTGPKPGEDTQQQILLPSGAQAVDFVAATTDSAGGDG